MPIHVLPPEVANKIAAGEVVERPASVVKELIENAIDAGADEIQVDIAEGGRRLVRVSDNGHGIDASDMRTAFLRHATSKLASVEDLFHIRTLGFRGEALASIASVSRVTLSSRAAEAPAGVELYAEGGQILREQPQARPVGTVVSVENLFFNTPARLKFMRQDSTEAGHVARLVTSYALSYPEKRFTLRNGQRLILRTTGTGELNDVVIALLGLDVAEQTLAIDSSSGDREVVRVWGRIGTPALQRANRRDITFFVNHRWVQDSSLSYAVTQAYRTLQPSGRYPLVVLHVELPPEEVDVNIHPTKREVRFRHANTVFAILQKAVRAALMAQRAVPLVTSPWQSPGSRFGAGGVTRFTPTQAEMAMAIQSAGPRADALGAATSQDQTAPPTERLPMLRVVGQVAQTYVIAEGPGGIYLIDQHAAHERVRYEELIAQQAGQGIAQQELLDPLVVELTPEQAMLLEDHLDQLAVFGFQIEPFGDTTFLVRAVPASLVGEAITVAITEMLDAAIEGQEGFSWQDQMLITLSCHTAIRAGQTLAPQEMRDLIRQLERSDLPHTCPHGRPTMLHLTQAQLEREFGRA